MKIKPKPGEYWKVESGDVVQLKVADGHERTHIWGPRYGVWRLDGAHVSSSYYGDLLYRCNPDGTRWEKPKTRLLPHAQVTHDLARIKRVIDKIRKCKTIREVRVVMEQYDKKGRKK